MGEDATLWAKFALQLVAWEHAGPEAGGMPVAWKVIAPGTGGSAEEQQTLAGYLARRDDPGYTNDVAASIGWPLPHPDAASALQLRAYDRRRFVPGTMLRNRLEAAILAPGDFPDVDTSVEPPRYIEVKVWAVDVDSRGKAAEVEKAKDPEAAVEGGEKAAGVAKAQDREAAVEGGVAFGWICARCWRSNAPFVPGCPCNEKEADPL